MSDYDVIVVGAGNAAFCSALAAAIDHGVKVAVLERAPEERSGCSEGRSGSFRIVFLEFGGFLEAFLEDFQMGNP